jgi:3-hydroxy-D-aspartate aldolase
MSIPAAADDRIVGQSLDAIDTPALLIDLDVLEANITAMAALCAGKPQRLRPHAKTHKSPIIAAMQRQAGAVGICCAKISEAEALAGASINDVLITTPLVGAPKLNRLAALASRVRVTTVVDDVEALTGLAEAAIRAGCTLDVLVEVDVGQNRCGVRSPRAAADLADAIAHSRSLRFVGLQGYQGRLQSIVSDQERSAAVGQAMQRLQQAAELVQARGHTIEILTGGGSGSVRFDLELGILQELQPGSYVFMDASYRKIRWDEQGSSPPFRPALTILGRVISRPGPERVVVDVGWKAASSDAGPPEVIGRDDLDFEFAGDEHGTLVRADGSSLDLRLGDTVHLLPSHCDTTVNLYSTYTVHRGDRVEAVWPVTARGCSR